MALLTSQRANGWSAKSERKFASEMVSGQGTMARSRSEMPGVRRQVGDRQALLAGERDRQDPEDRIDRDERRDEEDHVKRGVRELFAAAASHQASVALVARFWIVPYASRMRKMITEYAAA